MQQTKKKIVKYRGELYADQTQVFFPFFYVFDFLYKKFLKTKMLSNTKRE